MDAASGVNLGLAFAAGVLSFLSPCVLPLIPSYLSFIGGASLGIADESPRSRLGAFYRTIAFVLGFSIVFVALGALFSAALGALGRLTQLVNLVAGLVVVLLGANFLFDFFKVLDLERRAHVSRRPAGLAGAMVVGMAFAAGWAPCVGPILSSILLLAGTSGEVGRGLVLLMTYSLGLGLPFLLTGLYFSRARDLLQRLRPRLPLIKTLSGLLLIVVGLLIAFGRLQRFNAVLFTAASRLRAWEAARPLLVRGLSAGLLAAGAAWGLRVALRRGRRASRPWAAAVAALLAAAAAATLAGLLRPWSLLALWLTYQGI